MELATTATATDNVDDNAVAVADIAPSANTKVTLNRDRTARSNPALRLRGQLNLLLCHLGQLDVLACAASWIVKESKVLMK